MNVKFFVLGLLVAVLILLSMIFSASETAFTSINKLRIRVLRGKKEKNAVKIGRLLDSKNKLLNTNLIGNSAVNIGVTAILTALITELSGESAVATATFVATVLLLIFGEITPKNHCNVSPRTNCIFACSVHYCSDEDFITCNFLFYKNIRFSNVFARLFFRKKSRVLY